MAAITDVLRHVLSHAGGLSEANRGEMEKAVDDFGHMLENLAARHAPAPDPDPPAPHADPSAPAAAPAG